MRLVTGVFAGGLLLVACLWTSRLIARRLTRTAQIPLLCSALTGALIVTTADLLARRMFSPTELPVGAVTAVAGAPLFIYLLRRNAPQ